MRRLLGLLGLSLALLSPAALHAQAPAESMAVVNSTTGDPTAAVAAPSGLPIREGPPRTLRAYWHVFAAFAIAWLLLFGYALSLGRRFARVERELRRLS